MNNNPLSKKLYCSLCKQEVTFFRDELAKREFGISGMCQECQDEQFELNKYRFEYDLPNGTTAITELEPEIYEIVEAKAKEKNTTIEKILVEIWEDNQTRESSKSKGDGHD